MAAGIGRVELYLRSRKGGHTSQEVLATFIFDSYSARRGMQIFPVGRPYSHPNRTQRHPRNESPTEKGGMGVSLLPWSCGGDAEVESYDKKPGNRNKGCNLDNNRVLMFISGP